MSSEITLPYVYAYPDPKEYAKAMKPLLKQWKFLHRDSQFSSPFEEHQWCWAQPYAQECYKMETA